MVLVSTTRGAYGPTVPSDDAQLIKVALFIAPAAATPPHARAHPQSRAQTRTPGPALLTSGFRPRCEPAIARQRQEILKDMNKGKNVTLTFLVPVEKQK